VLKALGLFARHGRFVLVAGLVAGVVLPNMAMTLRPWLSELVLLLLFLTAFRVGFPHVLDGLRHLHSSIGIVLFYQLALPLICIAIFAAFGLAQSPVAIALTLMLAAPSVTGSPNLAVMLGHPPDLPFRLLILGTLILPATIIPIFWLSPALGGLADASHAALRLCLAIASTISLAFVFRAFVRPKMRPDETRALDGLTTLTFAVVVVGLMSAVAPALAAEPWTLAGWMCVAFGANIGLQALAYLGLRHVGMREGAAPIALVAGNRNVALFLLASNATQTEEFLIFLGCYQFPMYLTPIMMRPFFGAK
jgi:hypothetical protein